MARSRLVGGLIIGRRVRWSAPSGFGIDIVGAVVAEKFVQPESDHALTPVLALDHALHGVARHPSFSLFRDQHTFVVQRPRRRTAIDLQSVCHRSAGGLEYLLESGQFEKQLWVPVARPRVRHDITQTDTAGFLAPPLSSVVADAHRTSAPTQSAGQRPFRRFPGFDIFDKRQTSLQCVYQQLAHSSAGTHRKIGVGRSCCGIGQSESDKVACLRNFPFCQGADIDEKA